MIDTSLLLHLIIFFLFGFITALIICIKIWIVPIIIERNDALAELEMCKEDGS